MEFEDVSVDVDGTLKLTMRSPVGPFALGAQVVERPPPHPLTASGLHAALLTERARIARELHDSVSQTLFAIILTATRARLLLKQNELNAMHDIIDDVLQLANA